MDVDVNKLEVINNTAANRFEIQLGDELAILEYMIAGKNIIYSHTEVPKAYGGQGIAGKLAYTAMEFAKAQGYKVQAVCPYVDRYVKKHPEYQSITWGY